MKLAARNLPLFWVASIFYCLISALLIYTIPQQTYHLECDSGTYLAYASNFQAYGSFIPPQTNICTTWIGIGYPLFLAIAHCINTNLLTIILLQLVLGWFILAAIIRLTFFLFGREAAGLASLLAAGNVGLITYPQLILSETLFCFVILWAFEQFLIGRNTFSGFLFGLSILIKSSVWFFIFALIIVLITRNVFPFTWLSLKKAAIALLLFVGSYTVPVASYLAYNYHLYGYWYLKAVDKVNLYTYFLPKLLAQAENIPLINAKEKVVQITNVTEYASGQGWEKAQTLLWDLVIKNPLTTARVALHNMIKTLCGLHTNQFKILFGAQPTTQGRSFFDATGPWWQKIVRYLSTDAHRWWIVLLGIYEIIYLGIPYLGASICCLHLLRKQHWWVVTISFLYISYFIAITFPDGCARLRLPAELLVIVLAAGGLRSLFLKFLNLCKR